LALRLLHGDENRENTSEEQGVMPVDRALDLRVRKANREVLQDVLAIEPTRSAPSYVFEGFRDEPWGSSPARPDPDPYLRGATVVSVYS
jgi:hypothetical protein